VPGAPLEWSRVAQPSDHPPQFQAARSIPTLEAAILNEPAHEQRICCRIVVGNQAFLFISMLGVAPFWRSQAWTGNIMEELQTFQAAARECGFVAAEEFKDCTVLWFRKTAQDAPSGTHQRLCLDSMKRSATVYWTNPRGLTDSKTFRSVDALREWLGGIPAADQLNKVASGS
jgi:hypothetical protein